MSSYSSSQRKITSSYLGLILTLISGSRVNCRRRTNYDLSLPKVVRVTRTMRADLLKRFSPHLFRVADEPGAFLIPLLTGALVEKRRLEGDAARVLFRDRHCLAFLETPIKAVIEVGVADDRRCIALQP